MSAPYTSAPYRITGAVIPAATPLPEPPPRLDICIMREEHPKQFTLFVLSWKRIMQPDFEPKAASFQEIAGIHGMPYVPWLGDPDEGRQNARGPWLGYCNHGSILFPNWHRPYLMLLEQIISDVGYGIASTFASKEQDPREAEAWMKAAAELRFPFWDWTHRRTGEEGVPDILKTPEIELEVPPGVPTTYENVLAYYRLNHPVDGFNNRWRTNRVYKESARAYFREWDRTYRHPNSQAVSVTEDYAAINALLKDGNPDRLGTWANLTNDVSGMFVFPLDIAPDERANAWDEFSNTAFQSGHRNLARPQEINSPYVWNATPIEQSHNLVHLVLGGIGHMGDNDTAGFDPIFFLHHCNVDRLLAFWEHIYPDYVAGTEGFLNPDGITRTPFTQGGGTWIETNNQVVDDRSPLPPFRNAGYAYWTSQGGHTLMYYPGSSRPVTISPINKYYTYPPIEVGNDKVKIDTDPERPTSLPVRTKQRRVLQDYFRYNPIKARDDTKIELLPDVFKKKAPYSGDSRRIPGRIYVENYRQFFVSANLDPTLIDGSYMLVVSVKVSAEVKAEERPFEIGRVAVLARGSSETCGNCQAQRAGGVRVRGVILIPHHLVAQVLVSALKNKEETPEHEIIETISASLQASLVHPDDTPHSKLQAEGPEGNERILPGDKSPYLELLSSEVYQQFDEGIQQPTSKQKADVPYDFDDWKRHTSLARVGGAELHWVHKRDS
ncbi:unnamed protein product [Rhizoctonia solani]|uniref:tyrosinase n=1 Tax=Rhizoctonia solani TaxID=456999 RepID=A0A8H3BVH4_9AGAM|nr:unnamed protein product [Rhizoctonia solani]